MSSEQHEWMNLIDAYVRETKSAGYKMKPADFESGRAILAAPLDQRAWFLMEAWRLNCGASTRVPYSEVKGESVLALASELIRLPFFCNPQDMQYIIWQAELDDLGSGLLRNVERHVEHWGIAPDVHKMLRIKRVELERINRNKANTALLQRIDALTG